MSGYRAKSTGNLLERRPKMFYWRGRYFSGLVDVAANVLYDDPEDSFADHVGFEGLCKSRDLIYKESKMIVPTVGRVVWYWPDGQVQMRTGDAQPCAAIIAHVRSNTLINIAYFDENGHAHNRTGVRLIQDERITPDIQDPFCTWMPFQVGQQAKTEALEKALQAVPCGEGTTRNKEEVIYRLWENSGHGTRREDVEAAYNAGVQACVSIAEAIHAEAERVAHPDAEGWTAECVEMVTALRDNRKAVSRV